MFSRFFINRPIFSIVISIVIMIAGLVTMAVLPVAQYPQITPPTIQVSTAYPGANATVLAETVAAPIEQQVNGVEGMLYMTSKCSNNGFYSLTITFEVGTDLDMAAVLVQNRVAIATPVLPEEVRRSGVTTTKRSTDLVLMITLTSPQGTLDDLFLSNYATLRIKDELSRVDGVGEVFSFGLGDYSMRLWLDPEKMKARKLTALDVIQAVQEQNVQVAAGQIGQPPTPKGQNFQYTVTSLGRLEDVEQFEDIIIKTAEGGRIIQVKDVATVELGSRSYDLSAQLNGKPTAALGVYQLPGANAIDLADRLEARMDELSNSFPEDLEYSIPFDTTIFVRSSIQEVITTLFIAVFLVFITIFVFLQDWRATLIPALTIPVSLIGTFAAMGLLGFSINMLTLFGIVLAIGIVVDDAIVVVENTARNIDDFNMPAKEATIKAMDEVAGPVVATTLVLLAVFIPTAFMGGITGQLYKQFALTIAAATVFSSINALTLSPALCAMLLRPTKVSRNPFFRAFEWGFGKTKVWYERLGASVLRRVFIMMLLFLGILGADYLGFTRLPTGFVPPEDQGWLLATAQLPDAASLERTIEVVDKVNKIYANMDGVKTCIAIPGFSILDGSMTSNAAVFWIMLDPWEERTTPELSINALVGEMMRAFQGIQEAQVLAIVPPAIPGLGVAGGFQMQLQDRGAVGLVALQQMAAEMARDANGQKGLFNVYTPFRANVPQIFAEIDRTKAKTLNVPLSSIFNTLQAYLGSAYVNDFNKFGRTFRVYVQADPAFRADVQDIRRLEVRNNQGRMIPLGTLVTTDDVFGPQLITRYNMYPAASIMGSAAPGYSSGQALRIMENLAESTLPANFGFEWTGMSYQERAVGGQAVFIFALAVIFVYLVLCAQYESWSLSFGVIMSVPLGILGAIIAVLVRDMDINVYTQIGFVLLVALASKNAILIIEFARDARQSGMSIREAAAEAARLRFRPILMTSFSFILGTFPLVVATGAAAASRRALGTAVFGGMIAATVLAVVFVPVFYVVIQSFSEWFSRKSKSPQEENIVEEPPAATAEP